MINTNNRSGGGGGGFKRPGGGAPRPGGNRPAGGGSRGRGGKAGGGSKGGFSRGGGTGPARVFNDPNSQENIQRREESGIKRGRVVEALPNAMFRVEYEDGTKGLGMIGGKLKVFKIRILVGDMVEAVIDPYSKKGRITKRG